MSRTNETRHIKWYETCKCKLDASVCNSKQRWNKDKFRCECKELIDKGIFDKGFIWNSSNCKCENCKCTKKLVDKLVEECNKNIDEVKISGTALFERRNECKSSCTICIVLIAVFTVSIGFGTYFIYNKYMNHDKKSCF